MRVCVLLTTSLHFISESWGDGVPTSESDQSVPRICCLLLCSLLLKPPLPILLTYNVCTRGKPYPALPPHQSTPDLSSHRIICPPGNPLSPSEHTQNTLYHTGNPVTWVSTVSIDFNHTPLTHIFHSMSPPPLPCPRHACQIPVATSPLLLQNLF